MATLPAGGFEAGVGAFDDHASLHLREGCHDVEEEFAAGGGGVESFCEGTECNAAYAEVVDGGDDACQCSGKVMTFSRGAVAIESVGTSVTGGVRFFAPGTTERNAASSGHLPRGARQAPTL